MKKYIVKTGNLNWLHIKGNDIIEVTKDQKSHPVKSVHGIVAWLPSDQFNKLLRTNPDWVEEIKEDELADNPLKALYTEKDMLEFGRKVTLNSTASVKQLLSDYKVSKFPPKEGQKKYAEHDMRSAFDVGMSYGSLMHNRSLTPIEMEFFSFEKWIKTYGK
jgi:hypothetical protein